MSMNKTIGGILLVSGTTIGGGVLALPIATIDGGFYPTAFTFLISWFFMTISALLMLEVCLWAPREINIISMASDTLGVGGKLLAWLTYVNLLYALISAYLTGSNAWLIKLCSDHFNFQLKEMASTPILACAIGAIIYCGTASADRINRVFAIGLLLSYSVLIVIGLPHVDVRLIDTGNVMNVPKTLPLIITTFGFSIIVPSLTFYFDHNHKKLRWVIIAGSIIPLLAYLLWELVTLGILSIDGPNGLLFLAKNQANGTEIALALENILQKPIINVAAKLFSVFAILTSFIGVSLSLFDFLADGLQVRKQGFSGFGLFLLTFLPPVIMVNWFPNKFDKILSFGGIFVAILLGLLPIAMAYSGRYKRKISSVYQVFGGKPLLFITATFFIYTIFQELYGYF